MWSVDFLPEVFHCTLYLKIERDFPWGREARIREVP
jgi:hypothetical protein